MKQLVLLFVMTFTCHAQAFSIEAHNQAILAKKSANDIVFGSTNNVNSILFKQANLILTHAFKQLGYSFTLVHLPNKRSMVWANVNKIDGVAFRIQSLTSIYPNLIKVEEELFDIKQYAFSTKNIKINGWQSIQPYRIAYERGTVFIENQKEQLEQLIPVNSTEQAFHMTFRDRADMTITGQSTGQAVLARNSALFKGAVKQQYPAITSLKLFSYMHNYHQELANQLATQLKAMKKSGKFEQLLQAI
ncbi:transporter substrate-binding domain-containing protein [Thalassotalea sp. G2M2-11]|uniref:substrate-binding periplasmic protein n=1 Tax=Thalassotalea sp. G2M2-11 TaxID=2787627 RepID=UPI0019D1CA2D|nr:transporter substrate-binding domain-containing protein [Thalassotalea sp. G2M2-11]